MASNFGALNPNGTSKNLGEGEGRGGEWGTHDHLLLRTVETGDDDSGSRSSPEDYFVAAQTTWMEQA